MKCLIVYVRLHFHVEIFQNKKALAMFMRKSFLEVATCVPVNPKQIDLIKHSDYNIGFAF